MTLKEIQKRNYQATVKRGLITNQTNGDDFLNKIREETAELQVEFDLPFGKIEEELADVILVCFAMAEHLGINIKQELIKKVKYNENRND